MCQIRASTRATPQCVDAISISLCHRCNLIFSSRDHLDKYLLIISLRRKGKPRCRTSLSVVVVAVTLWLSEVLQANNFVPENKDLSLQILSFELRRYKRQIKRKQWKRKGLWRVFFVHQWIWLLVVTAFVDDDVQGWQGRSYKLQEMQGFKKKVDSASRLAPHSQQVPSPTYQGMQPKGQSNPPKSPPPSRVSLKIGTK